MIAPMKKYSFLIFHQEYTEFLKRIQELGVLHIIEKETGEIEDEELRKKYRIVSELKTAIKFLKRLNPENEFLKSNENDGLKILEELKKFQHDLEENHQKLLALQKEINAMEPWGNFSWENLEKLKEKDLHVHFFTCSPKRFNPNWKGNYNIAEISEAAGQKYFIVIQEGNEEINIDAEELKLPQGSLSELKKAKQAIEGAIDETKKIFDTYSKQYLTLLEESIYKLSEEIDFNNVILNTEKHAEERLMLLEGWIPKDKEEQLISFLEESRQYYIAEDPKEEDKPPILLKNKKFPKLFEPIGDLFMLPKYTELDLTPFFAPFFMLFFGFCLGDAGYGLLMVIGLTLFKFKAKKKIRPLISLGQYLGIATVLFGMISGTFFGMNLLDTGYTLDNNSIMFLHESNVPDSVIIKLTELKGVTIEKHDAFIRSVEKLLDNKELFNTYKGLIIKSANSDISIIQSFRYLMLNSQSMFYFALVLGLIQIVFGMFVKVFNIIRQKGFLYSLPTVGWITLIIGFSIIGYINKIYNPEIIVKPYVVMLLAVGSILILGFNNPKNIFASFGGGLYDIYSTLSGLLGDSLSYIRLFALGLSSAILGFVFNDLASQLLGGIPVLSQLLFIVLLLFGHTLNFMMAALGSFVHPVRLTFVEFYKNAGFSGGGKEYKPFKKYN